MAETYLKLTWNPVPGVAGYNVYLKKQSDHIFTRRNKILLTSPGYELQYLGEDGNYDFYVTAVKAGAEYRIASKPSNAVSRLVSGMGTENVSQGLDTANYTASSVGSGTNPHPENAWNPGATPTWIAASNSDEWCQVDLGTPRRVRHMIHRNANTWNTPRFWRLEGSNDETNWDILLDIEQDERVHRDEPHEIPRELTGLYQYYRVYVVSSWANNIHVAYTRLFAVV